MSEYNKIMSDYLNKNNCLANWKWVVRYVRFTSIYAADEIIVIGCSNKEEQELFSILENKFPNMIIRKTVYDIIDGYPRYTGDYDKNGIKCDSPYEDYISFTSSMLQEF